MSGNDMDWSALATLRRFRGFDNNTLATLLLLHDAPPAPAALAVLPTLTPLVQMALAPAVASALAAWRADPQRLEHVVGADEMTWLAQGVAEIVGALGAEPAVQRDAITLALRDGDDAAIDRCLAALSASGWAALDADLRAALLKKASAAAIGWIWSALDDGQRAAAAQEAMAFPGAAARLIGRIGAAAWRATDQEVRRRLIDAVVRDALSVSPTAPAWAGMIDDERARLIGSVVRRGAAADAFRLLEALSPAGRATLTAEQRAAIETLARCSDAWRVLALRVADVGWNAVSAKDRADVLAPAEQEPWRASVILHHVGVAGWRAMRDDDRARLAAIARRTPDAFFRCPPPLWSDLAGASLPPATEIPRVVIGSWRVDAADANLSLLPPTHQAAVLALAPWRTADAAPDSVRVLRLRDAWTSMTTDERVALARAHPSVLAVIAADAHMHGGGAGAAAAVAGETVAQVVATTDACAVRYIVGVMIASSNDWRDWMDIATPTAADPPEVWEAWRHAARLGLVSDLAVCARLATRSRAAEPSRARRRARFGRAAAP